MNEWTQFSWALTPGAYTLIENHFHPWNMYPSQCFTHLLWLCVHTLLPTFGGGSRAVAITCCIAFTLFYLNLILPPPCDLEGTFIICAFMSRSPPPPGPRLTQLSVSWGGLLTWVAWLWMELSMGKQRQYYSLSSLFSKLLWTTSFPSPGFLTHS